jgi:hypothetical protein
MRAASKEAICRSRLAAADPGTAARIIRQRRANAICISGRTCFRTRRAAQENGLQSEQCEDGERHNKEELVVR